MAVQPSVTKLKSKLAASKVKEEDFALYTVINQLIDMINQSQGSTSETISSGIGSLNNQIAELKELDFLTHSDESVALENARQLLAGSNITFDDTVDNQRTINAASGSSVMRTDPFFMTPKASPQFSSIRARSDTHPFLLMGSL